MFHLKRLQAFAEAPLPEVRESSTKRLVQRIIQEWNEALDTPGRDTELCELAELLLEQVQSHYRQTELEYAGAEIASLFETIRQGMALHIQACTLLVEKLNEGNMDANDDLLKLVAAGDVHLAQARTELKRYNHCS